MHETHKEIQRWSLTDFPYELTESDMDALHEVLPRGYWVAFDYSAADEVAVALMKNEGHTNE